MEEALKKLIEKIVGSKYGYLRLIVPNRDDLSKLINSVKTICTAPIEGKKLPFVTFRIVSSERWSYVYSLDGLEKVEKLIFPLTIKISTLDIYKYNSGRIISTDSERESILNDCKRWMVDSNLNGSSVEYVRANYGVKIEIENQDSSLEEFLQVYTEGQDIEIVKYKESLK